jgi:hypothetical protein
MSRAPRCCRLSARRRWPAALLAAALMLVAAPAALADSTQSANWAGYAAHRSGVSFSKVVATWRQPSATCTQGSPTYSSLWVGLGGYSLNSRALEQIGSEVDCTVDGRVTSSAWYELVPAPSRSIHMTVAPGDELSALVSVTGHEVRLQLRDLTRHTAFTRTVKDKTLDVTSADWILEAPSECSNANQCQTLNLADFGSAGFTGASATTTKHQTGRISSHRWGVTKITLTGGQRHFIGATSSGAHATPSSLTAGGSAFSVAYSDGSSGAPTETTSLREAPRAPGTDLRPGGVRVG